MLLDLIVSFPLCFVFISQLFGVEDPDEAVSPDGEDPENMADAGQTAAAATDKDEVVRVSTRQWAKETQYDASKLFNKLFCADIKYLLSMAKLWEKRKAPQPLDWLTTTTTSETAETAATPTSSGEVADTRPASHKMWSVQQCCGVFAASVKALHARLGADAAEVLYWDKDDEEAMDFVASAANLRCTVFSIANKSKFEVKSLAGNIIPAIASTNAIVAGLIVLQALKCLEGKFDECRTVFLREKVSCAKGRLVQASQLVKPNDKCYVCASQPEISVRLNMHTFTVSKFESRVLKAELHMLQPDVEIDDGTGRIIISSEEGETEGILSLSHNGISQLLVSHF